MRVAVDDVLLFAVAFALGAWLTFLMAFYAGWYDLWRF